MTTFLLNDYDIAKDGIWVPCGTSSVLTEKSGEVPFKSKSLPVKKPALKRGKTDQMAKALELL